MALELHHFGAGSMLDILKRMRDRVLRDSEDSDAGAYTALLLELELVMKLVTCALVACIRPDREGHHYRQAHELARADSIGKFVAIADEILVGPTAAFLYPPAQQYTRELTQNVDEKAWQYSACADLTEALSLIGESPEQLPARVQGRRWLSLAAHFRNSSNRGHGAETQSLMAKRSRLLAKSIKAVEENLSLFSCEWVYLHRNLSGKYRVLDLGGGATAFQYLKTVKDATFEDGVYIALDSKALSRVEFVHTDVDVADYFIPNGAFNGKAYQSLSYISGSKRELSAGPYMKPAGELPRSETHGEVDLDILGSTFSNIPPQNVDYIRRPSYEQTLSKVLLGETHPIVTLSGRGGIGKTSIALQVLHEVAGRNRYFAIMWFSARDIDLVGTGPKMVAPAVMSLTDVSKAFLRYLGIETGTIKPKKAHELFAEWLSSSSAGALLLVLDNFETFVDPADLFEFLDAYLRPPNKILITSRERVYFRGDYGIEIFGMDDGEAESLISVTAERFGIPDANLTRSYRADLIKESSGHPYIIKFLLGEVARGKQPAKIERILGADDAMLQALFERTYATLSPAAKRTFLTLCAWRSLVFRIALEAVLLRPENDRIEPYAIDELLKSSFIESTEPTPGRQELLSVPLVAQIFGRGKLSVSPLKAAIDADVRILQMFGALQLTDQAGAFEGRLRRFIGHLAAEPALLPIVEIIGSRHVITWRNLSDFYEEQGNVRLAREILERFLERVTDTQQRIEGWRRYIALSMRLEERLDEIRGLAELASVRAAPFVEISAAANRLNGIFAESPSTLEGEERRAIIGRVADVMQARIMEGDATDRSRLSWLYQGLGSRRAALEVAFDGLRLEPENSYCRKIVASMTPQERIRFNL